MLYANHLKWLSVNEISTLSKPLPVARPRGIHGLPVVALKRVRKTSTLVASRIRKGDH